jgi:hypothetical protein
MILIENEIVFLSVPKNASISVHYALEESELKIEPTWDYEFWAKKALESYSPQYHFSNHKIKIHNHLTTNQVYYYLNKKLPTIFIKRDYCERFISALNYILNFQIVNAYGYEYSDILNNDILPNIDNDWLYKTFTKDIIEKITFHIMVNVKMFHSNTIESYEDIVHKSLISSLNKFVKNKKRIKIPKTKDIRFPNPKYVNFNMLGSQEIYKSGYIPEHIFDIYELDKLENFIKEKFGKEIKIKKENSADKSKIKTNFINDDKLRNWVWDNFEKQYFIKKLF